MISIENFLSPSIRGELEDTLKNHREFLKIVEQPLFLLTENHSELFRRKPASRIKTIASIYKKLRPKITSTDEILPSIKRMNDIAGVRLTIGTNDQYEEAKELITKSLLNIGNITESRKPFEKKDATPYQGEHLIIEGSKNAFCEIQIRTLSSDLWAVFAHYESYKYNGASDATKNELNVYANLMNVVDDYASLIRKRKIIDAEMEHKNKSGSVQGVLLDFNKFEEIISRAQNTEELRGFSGGFEVVELCSALRMIHEYKIFTEEELKNLLYKNDNINLIKELMNQNNVIELNFCTFFHILCVCKALEKDSERLGHSLSIKNTIEMYLQIEKLENTLNELDKVD